MMKSRRWVICILGRPIENNFLDHLKFELSLVVIAFILWTGVSEDSGSEYIPSPRDDKTDTSEDDSYYTELQRRDISCKCIHIINIVSCLGGEFIMLLT
jgi:hypothetical protein